LKPPLIITSRLTNSCRCIANQHRHERPVPVPDQIGGLADDRFQERDHVVGHELVGDRTVDVGHRARRTTSSRH
jgi:hypothetical protein